jgi:hypothetical protein
MFHNPMVRPGTFGGAVLPQASMISVQANHVRGQDTPTVAGRGTGGQGIEAIGMGIEAMGIDIMGIEDRGSSSAHAWWSPSGRPGSPMATHRWWSRRPHGGR